MAADVMPAELEAARFAGNLWAAICAAGAPHAPGREARHLAGTLDAGWLASLPLPAGQDRPASQPAALIDARHEKPERHLDQAALERAYALRPRTQMLEDIAHGQPDAWYALAARHLTRLSDSGLHVTCTIYWSRHGDETFGPHRDTWYGAVVQAAGVKDWLTGEGLLDGTGIPARQVTTRAGDILLLPKYLPHVVTTPADPGHSVHLAFAIDCDAPPRAGDLTRQPGLIYPPDRGG